MKADITGNYTSAGERPDRLSVRERDVPDGEKKTFVQTLRLIAGERYILRFLYDTHLDRAPMRALGGGVRFSGVTLDGKAVPLCFCSADGRSYSAQWEWVSGGEEARLVLSVCSTRPFKTELEGELPLSEELCGVPPEEGGEYALCGGIPFLVKKIVHRFAMPGFNMDFANPFGKDCGSLFFPETEHPLGGVRADRMYLCGMVHSLDVANGAWASKRGDNGFMHFAGDHAGDLLLRSGEKTEKIPLIFGVNLWYCAPYDMVWHYQKDPYTSGGEAENFDAVLFSGEEAPREILSRAVRLTDGTKYMAAWFSNVRYVCSVELDPRTAYDWIRLVPDPALYEYPVIAGVTFRCKERGSLVPLPQSGMRPRGRVISLAERKERGWEGDLEALKHLLYTYADEKPKLREAEKPEGYFGPQYRFCGTQEAVYAATFLYYNGPECASHIGDRGTDCSSSTCKWALNHYTHGYGAWIDRPVLFDGLPDFLKKYRECSPGGLGGTGTAWSRGIGELLREAACFGYGKFIDSYLDWLDGCLFSQADPPHWNRIVGQEDQPIHRHGALTERGNRENDGHGICMWARYLLFHKFGRSADWNRRRYAATRASAEWIVWQMDTAPVFPGTANDVLYTDSECAYGSYDFYSTYNCLWGLRGAIAMAEQLGEKEDAARWRAYSNRLRRGILRNLTDDSPFGKIWHTEHNTEWQDHAHKLAHIQLAPDGDTYTPLQDYADDPQEKEFLAIDQNSYRYLREGATFNSLRMYGYGQGFFLQAALLLDRMADAEGYLNMLVDHCYLPKFGKWVCPEGIILHPSGEYYIAVNNYMGQDSHLADSTKALRLMLGVDDNRIGALRLIPRFPQSFREAEVSEFPVAGGGRISYRISRTEKEYRIEGKTSGAEHVRYVRFGPLSESPLRVCADGAEVPFEAIRSGDSVWAGIRLKGKEKFRLCARLR